MHSPHFDDLEQLSQSGSEGPLGEGDDDLQPEVDGEEGSEEEQVEAGPDVPAPSLDELRAAMEWAFSGEEVESSLLDSYARHAELLLDENRRVNLTAILDPKEVHRPNRTST